MSPVTGLSLGRILVGLLAFVRPELGGRLFGFDVAANRELPTMARLFASREIALGTLTLLARGAPRRRLAMVGVAVDSSDAVTGLLGLRERSASKVTGVMLVAGAVGAVAAGLAEVRRG